ncbi:MAG: hypothetical protein J3Q66DRAFT_352737 [Benniella sp.]|nr:MAG: hypothetical protein J3Q66DRAFT_352737 [Benniella sp.]
MAITSPLVLPEIRESLAPFLTSDDLARCVRVCKAWHASFLPFLWGSIEVSADKGSQPSLDFMQQHCDSIRRLIYHGKVPMDHIPLVYPVLRTLHLLQVKSIESGHDPALDIITAHPSLTHLRLQSVTPGAPISRWILPTNMSSLNTLSLTGIVLVIKDMDGFWKLLLQLETLEMAYSGLASGHYRAPEGDWKLKSLSLVLNYGMSQNDQLAWIRRCTRLRRLQWRALCFPRQFPIEEFTQSVVEKTWPELEDLSLVRCGASDQQLSLIISGMRRVLGLSVTYGDLRELSMAALRPHFPWIRHLDVLRNFGSTKELTVEVLRRCPRLETLRANRIPAHEVIEGPRWACEKTLKVLEVCFQVVAGVAGAAGTTRGEEDEGKEGKERKERNRLLERIARLVQLERLDISNQDESPMEVSSVVLSKKKGMEQLGRLTHLREVCVEYTQQESTVEDVEWMIQQWPSLRRVEGTLHTADPLCSRALMGRLSQAGIAVRQLSAYRPFAR